MMSSRTPPGTDAPLDSSAVSRSPYPVARLTGGMVHIVPTYRTVGWTDRRNEEHADARRSIDGRATRPRVCRNTARRARALPDDAPEPPLRRDDARPVRRRAGPRAAASLHRAGGRRGGRLLGAPQDRRDPLDPPRSPPLPRQGRVTRAHDGRAARA